MEHVMQWIYCVLFFLGGVISVVGIILSFTMPELESRSLFASCFAGCSIALFMIAVIDLKSLIGEKNENS